MYSHTQTHVRILNHSHTHSWVHTYAHALIFPFNLILIFKLDTTDDGDTETKGIQYTGLLTPRQHSQSKPDLCQGFFYSTFSLFSTQISALWRFQSQCSIQFSSVTQSCPTLCDPMNHRVRLFATPWIIVSNSLRPHESQHARPPCPSPTPEVHWDSCPSSQWCRLVPSLHGKYMGEKWMQWHILFSWPQNHWGWWL